jgi:hypothetical protein
MEMDLIVATRIAIALTLGLVISMAKRGQDSMALLDASISLALLLILIRTVNRNCDRQQLI